MESNLIVNYDVSKIIKDMHLSDDIGWEVVYGKKKLDKTISLYFCNSNNLSDFIEVYPAPRIGDVTSYLLEKFKIWIIALPYESNKWKFVIFKMNNNDISSSKEEINFNSYPQAINTGLKIVLNKLNNIDL